MVYSCIDITRCQMDSHIKEETHDISGGSAGPVICPTVDSAPYTVQ
jgi:hypothetical protein